MAELDAAELETVLDAAQRYLYNYDYDNAYAMLHPVAEEPAASGEGLGRVYSLLGEACHGLGSLDASMYYFEAALPLLGGSHLEYVNRRIVEIQNVDAAVDAVDEGVAGEDEGARVIRAASDAYDRHDYEEARRWYQSAYDGLQLNDQQVGQAALGLALCAMHDGELEQAEGYLQVAEARHPAYAENAAMYRQHLAERQAGMGIGDDGVSLSEIDEINRAAIVASHDNDYVTARHLFEQLLDSDVMPATDRGRVWRNIGVICLYEHDYDGARRALEEAVRTGSPMIQEQSTRILQELDDNARAEEIVAAIDFAEG